MRPLIRASLSLVIVLVAYAAYALTAVPLIEPATEVLAAMPAPLLSSIPAAEIDPQGRMYQWFGPDRGAWELQKPKMLRNEQGILLFDRYLTDPEKLGPKGDRKVRLEPVSLVFFSDDKQLDPQVRDRQAVIMQAPGAVLEFDRPFNIVKGNVGRLVGGTLTGAVVIHSQGKSPGPEDDLRIVTQDVKLTTTSITTSHRVKFEHGPNTGHGTELDIRLMPEEERRETHWGRIQTLTLKNDIELDLVVEQRSTDLSSGLSPLGRLGGGGPSGAPREFSPEQPIVVGGGSPVKLTCRGPFELNALQNVAAFERRVVVTRHQPGASVAILPDKLTCHRLELHLVPPDKKTVAAKNPRPAEATQGSQSLPKVQVRRVVAIGVEEERGIRPAVPAVLEVPGSQVYAKGQRLEYDLETRRVSLVDPKEAVFQHGTNELHARELHYQPGPDGRLGRFEAEGAGWLNWEARDLRAAPSGGIAAAQTDGQSAPGGEPRRFLARWGRKLFSLPSEGRQVISLLGEAKAQVSGMGQLDAEEIHAWLIEQPQPATPVGVTPSQKPKYDLLPDRMMALAGGKDAKVTIDSPQLTGRTDELKIFVHRPADEGLRQDGGPGLAPAEAMSRAPGPAVSDHGPLAHRVSSANPVVSSGAVPAVGQTSAGPARVGSSHGGLMSQSSQRVDVSGQRMQVQVAQVGRETQWRQIDIFGGARLRETQTARPDERPLEVTGGYVRATQPEPDAARVTVTGDPAHVEGRGLSLTGAAINLDQRANQVWIERSGVMTLLVDRDLQGERLARPAPVEITWAGGMRFDGKSAVFDRDVLVKQQQATLRTRTLEAVLSQPIDLARPKQDGSQRPQIDRVICSGGLFLERATSDARGPVAIEKLEAADLTINQVTGDMFGNGPGWLTRVYRRDSELEMPGAGARPGAAATPAPKSAPAGLGASPFTPPSDPDKPLNYLRVDFQHALQGDLHKKMVRFSVQVQAIHAPVRAWEDTVNPDRIELLGPRGVVLKCDELHLNEMRRGEAKWFEASARGNTKVEGETFDALADRLNYSQEKDLLVLQGTDRAPAELWRQEGVGAPRSLLKAREIEFWRRDNHIKITKAQYLDVNDIPADKGRSRPKLPR